MATCVYWPVNYSTSINLVNARFQFSNGIITYIQYCYGLHCTPTDDPVENLMPLSELAEQIVNEVWSETDPREIEMVINAEEVEDAEDTHELTYQEICKCKQGRHK